jgi:hypothetical protein
VATFTFSPPVDCSLPGTVDFSGSLMPVGASSAVPFSFPGVPYTVAADGTLTITLSTDITLTGAVGLVNGNEASSFVYMASPGLFRLAGTAVKAGPTGTTGPGAFYAAHPGQRFMGVLANGGTGTVTTVGTPAAPTVSAGTGGTILGVLDGNGPWVELTTGATAGRVAVVNGSSIAELDWNPELYGRIRTGPDIPNVRYWVGWFSGDPSGSATPAFTELAAFRFEAGVDTNWQFCTGNPGGQTCTDTTVAVAASTAYSLWVTCDGSQCLGYVTGVLRATHTTNLPPAFITMGERASMTNLAAAARSFLFGRFTILHK